MHVPWAWIKQRPHFIAEFLNENYDLQILYKLPLKVSKKNLKNKKDDKLKISSFFVIPFKRLPILKNFGFLEVINNVLLWWQLPSLKDREFIWLTSWSLYRFIERHLPKEAKVIWDCMDDELEFPDIKSNPLIYAEALDNERKLMKRADIVFCSSEYLKGKVIGRSGITRAIHVLNNAIGIPTEIKAKEGINLLGELDNIFMYAGTISSWFDFDSVIHSLNHNSTLNFLLIGPSDVSIPIHPRLHYLGTVQREDLFWIMEKATALTMPFQVNELILSVNPVKLYEYIYMCKPIIASKYPETEKFNEYVYLYKNKEEFSKLAEGIIKGDSTVKKSGIEAREFAKANTWESRYKALSAIIQP